MNLFTDPWPWYIAGPAIALVLLALLLGGKTFGMSSNMRTLCAICGAGNSAKFFDFEWRTQIWNLLVIGGALLGGLIAQNFMNGGEAIPLNPAIVSQLQETGIASVTTHYMPTELFASVSMEDPYVILLLIVGGFLVGFGTRYAGGCTSGHAISGLANLQLPSLIAVIGFFVGGLTATYFILPTLLSYFIS
ncbi:MAG: YeeE/YedE family protein [Saprospiraceae bacterium]